ncbi:FAD-dependent oxidoreductase [Asticcacaulis endophyticus]|uniref:Oxidoreductase n=1 Tax=Asticcacaulis endophyticus TaxID=1395890 RepID=A0A918Q4J0_9CAUL|nr:FAD-binding protein [Asticcacaulis endophyticus]GGZ30867.1 oxidoreductase [Asticcacaulis endophyticus]
MSRTVYSTDVLVIGGGLAGCWAAVAAVREGVRVILAEKGYVGTSGVTATAGPGHWWVPPNPPELRQKAIAERHARGMGLSDPQWMARIIDTTWKTLPTLSNHYHFYTENGVTHYRGLRGPEYMRAMRALAIEAGVTIMDQSPIHDLTLAADGSVAGAVGEHRQLQQAFEVKAGAVVMATGGCAFFSHLLGSGNNTGDGYRMAVAAGADLSGMEFTNYYTVAPVRSNMTRSMAYSFARYFDSVGRELDIKPGPEVNEALAKALMRGKVFCWLDRVPQDIQAIMPHVQPNFVAPFDRRGINPYRDRFEVTLRGEGTIRGIGGINVIDDACQTRVPGLFAAGDAATRELIAGAVSGGGAQNSAWALSSGQWAGRGAARRRQIRTSEVVSMRISGAPLLSVEEVVTAVRQEMEPPAKNMFRSDSQLRRSLQRMDAVWAAVRDRPVSSERWRDQALRATVATARWSLNAALTRTESRGMHRRTDFPALDPHQAHRLIVSGMDQVAVCPHFALATPLEAL